MLHAGLNAPSAPRPVSDPRFFGVGIQHLTQVVLPEEETSAVEAALAASPSGGGGIFSGASMRNVGGSTSESGSATGGAGGDGMLRVQARATWDDPVWPE